MGLITKTDREEFLRARAWAERKVKLTEGDHAGKMIDFQRSPWAIEILSAYEDWHVRAIHVWKATQGAGTTLAEVLCAWTMSYWTQNILWNAENSVKASRQALRTLPKLKAIDEISEITRKAKTYELLGHEGAVLAFFMRMQAANPGNLQSDTSGRNFNDETWRWKKGLRQQARKRGGAMRFGKDLDITSASEQGEDADIDYRRGTQKEWHLRCVNPQCEQLFWPLWGKRAEEIYGQLVVQWQDNSPETVRLVCPHCGHQHFDTPKTRQLLTHYDRAQYVQMNDRPDKGVESFRWNALTMPWVPWYELVEEFLSAVEELKTGQGVANLRIFILTRMVEAFAALNPNIKDAQYSGDYGFVAETVDWLGEPIWHAKPASLPDGEQWRDDEGNLVQVFKRLMTVDVQQKEFFVVIRDMASDLVSTRMIHAGHYNSWEQLDKVQEFFEVHPRAVGVDCGTMVYEIQQVYKESHLRGWWCLEGEGRRSAKGYMHNYSFTNRQGKDQHRSEIRAYDKVRDRPIALGDRTKGVAKAKMGRKFARAIRWSNKMIKDLVYAFRNGDGPYFGVPRNHHVIPGRPANSDHESEYEFQMRSEQLQDKIDDETASSYQYWKQIHRNHYWDCECMIEVLKHLYRDWEKLKIRRYGRMVKSVRKEEAKPEDPAQEAPKSEIETAIQAVVAGEKIKIDDPVVWESVRTALFEQAGQWNQQTQTRKQARRTLAAIEEMDATFGVSLEDDE